MLDEPQDIREVSSSALPKIWAEIGGRFRDYLALTKPEINALILIVTLAGGWLSLATSGSAFLFHRLLDAVLGTSLVAAGAGALNQALEKPFDALMTRTMRRPVASGRIPVLHALCFGTLLALAGAIWLLACVNGRAALLALFALGVYILIYTPLKRKSSACIAVGAVAGAVPPLIGWVACGGSMSLEAGLIFALLFLWQFPHFMAIAWLCRKDYERAGYHVIPAGHLRTAFVAIATLIPALALLVLTTYSAIAHDALIYVPAICVIGLAFLFFGIRLVIVKSNSVARQLLAASVYYLPAAFALLILVEIYRPSIR